MAATASYFDVTDKELSSRYGPRECTEFSTRIPRPKPLKRFFANRLQRPRQQECMLLKQNFFALRAYELREEQ